MSEILLLALALVLVFEGLLYAFFPEAMKKMMAMVLHMPAEQLRLMGFITASLGVFFSWCIRSFM